MAGKRALRSDGLRNRAHVLETAKAVFAAEGIAVPIDEVARRAGVGVGTVYRHFPTKEALFAAIVHDRIAGAAAHAKSLAKAADPGAAFFAFLDRMWLEGSHKRDLVDALGADWKAKAAGPAAGMKKAIGVLLRRAQAAGAVRAGLEVHDVLALLGAAFAASPSRRLFDVVRDGLRG